MAPVTDRAPVVSVVIPTHNRARMLRRALQSVLAQTYSRWECVVVDDASTDDTPAVVQGFTDRRIRYLRLPVNKGQCAARNRGIEVASGSYIAFLDSDDEWLPDKLQAQVAVFTADESGRLGVVLCGLIKIAEHDGAEVARRIPAITPHPLDDLLHLRENPATYTLMVKRDCFDRDVWDEQLPHRTDWDLCVRIARKYTFAVVPQYLVRAYQHDGPRTSHPEKPWSGWEYCIEKYGADLRRHPRALAQHHYFAFRSYFSAGVLSGARRHLTLALWYDPLHPGRWITLGGLLLGVRTTNAMVGAYEKIKQAIRRDGRAGSHADHGTLRTS